MDTVDFSKKYQVLTITAAETVTHATMQLADTLRRAVPAALFVQVGDNQLLMIKQLATIFGSVTSADTDPGPRVPRRDKLPPSPRVLEEKTTETRVHTQKTEEVAPVVAMRVPNMRWDNTPGPHYCDTVLEEDTPMVLIISQEDAKECNDLQMGHCYPTQYSQEAHTATGVKLLPMVNAIVNEDTGKQILSKRRNIKRYVQVLYE